ncbi:MAG: hypothetical protein JXI43_09260 [Tissierellales bacterium]|nr:hypothetical protein [Tissierellales bacterium]
MVKRLPITAKQILINDLQSNLNLSLQWRQSLSDQAFAIDFTIFLEMIVEFVLKRINDYLKNRKKKKAKLSHEEILQIKNAVLNFGIGQTPDWPPLINPQLAKQMADSIEKILKNNPEALIDA